MKKYMKNKFNWFLVSGPIIAYTGMKLSSLKILQPWFLNFTVGLLIVFIGVHLVWMSWLSIIREIKEDEYNYKVID